MIRGSVFHRAVVDVFIAAKRIIYQLGVSSSQTICKKINQITPPSDLPEASGLSEEALRDIHENVSLITEFEKTRVCSRIQEILMKHPYIGEDSLVNLALPVVVEQKLDGSFLGLSPNLSTDAFIFFEPMIIDLKFGEPKDFHHLSTTGYALVMEAVYEFPINLGCIVYVDFKGDRIIVKKDLHIIGDELRQWFIETRDSKARMVEEEIDPGLPEKCNDTCPYLIYCG
jgi:CRISPR-associated protein Csa1